MAIISCPKCNKNISSHTMLCPYCGFQRGEVAEEQLTEFRRRKLRDRIYHLKMTSYAALALLISAFAWYLVEAPTLQKSPSIGPVVLIIVAVPGYLLTRIFLYKTKAALRKLSI